MQNCNYSKIIKSCCALRIFLAVVQVEKNWLFRFSNVTTLQKSVYASRQDNGNSVTNVVANIDMDALKFEKKN